MRAELGLVGSIRAVNQLMTIIEQGRPWEEGEGMSMTMGEQHGERDELWRLENNDRNWMILPAHTCRSLTSPTSGKCINWAPWEAFLLSIKLPETKIFNKFLELINESVILLCLTLLCEVSKKTWIIFKQYACFHHTYRKLVYKITCMSHTRKVLVPLMCSYKWVQDRVMLSLNWERKKGGREKHFVILQLAGFNFPPF